MAYIFNYLKRWLFPLGQNLNENLLKASLIISLRWVILTVEFLIAVVYSFLGQLKWSSYALIVLSIMVLVIFNTVVMIWIKDRDNVKTPFLAGQLLFDLFQLFIFLKLIMPTSTPLIEIFYLPLIVALITLPFVWNFLYTVVIAVIVGSFYLSKGADHHNYHHFYSHLFTMTLIWLTLNLLMSFIRHFQERLQNVQNYKQRMDHLKVVGAMTSGFCHQMATPLNTIKLRLDRMNRHHEFSQDDINSALMAMGQCEGALRELSELRVNKDIGLYEKIEIKSFCQNLIHDSYPNIHVHVDDKVHYVFSHPQLLTQTLLDLFDNAIDATKSGHIDLKIYQDNNFFHFEVINYKSRISEEVLEKVGEPFNSTKEIGAGLGLFNAVNTALMMNGAFKIFNKEESVHALLSLPQNEGML